MYIQSSEQNHFHSYVQLTLKTQQNRKEFTKPLERKTRLEIFISV